MRARRHPAVCASSATRLADRRRQRPRRRLEIVAGAGKPAEQIGGREAGLDRGMALSAASLPRPQAERPEDIGRLQRHAAD